MTKEELKQKIKDFEDGLITLNEIQHFEKAFGVFPDLKKEYELSLSAFAALRVHEYDRIKSKVSVLDKSNSFNMSLVMKIAATILILCSIGYNWDRYSNQSLIESHLSFYPDQYTTMSESNVPNWIESYNKQHFNKVVDALANKLTNNQEVIYLINAYIGLKAYQQAIDLIEKQSNFQQDETLNWYYIISLLGSKQPDKARIALKRQIDMGEFAFNYKKALQIQEALNSVWRTGH